MLWFKQGYFSPFSDDHFWSLFLVDFSLGIQEKQNENELEICDAM